MGFSFLSKLYFYKGKFYSPKLKVIILFLRWPHWKCCCLISWFISFKLAFFQVTSPRYHYSSIDHCHTILWLYFEIYVYLCIYTNIYIYIYIKFINVSSRPLCVIYIGAGNGNPLQCSCLENPRDGGAWWAAVYGVAQSRARLKWCSNSSSSFQFSGSVTSDSLRPHGLQQARPPCPSPTPGVYSDSSPFSQWCHPTNSSSVVPFSSCLNLFQHQGLFQWVSSLHQVATGVQHQSSQWIFRTDFI